MEIVSPVIKPAFLSTKNATALAISSGCPSLFWGYSYCMTIFRDVRTKGLNFADNS
ncbi:hypothetical protein REISMN_03255 [Rickettsia tamurae subsp. buchneri]|uniref:Uncharacterized protein n=1 Tax=Rickettsia tamurae subsp. buchneri TaxID=1462938 RepID=A0A8E1C020_9RICK|nr:hypothetical protein REISMN_03255 [Rickettsia tamurae subsp. buchneri]